MIFFDTTSASSWRHSSGLARVSRRLKQELGGAATGAGWPEIGALPGKSDWILTPELFSEAERPGLTELLDRRPCRMAAIYHDAIPIRWPDITWPRSVERHPSYMKLLARFDRVWAVSEASREELLGFWHWQGLTTMPQVDVLHLGADWAGMPRFTGPKGTRAKPRRIVSVGILEPRKNQGVLLDAFEALAGEGIAMELHLVGRINPHFGKPIKSRVEAMAARLPGLKHHENMDDAGLAALVGSARATAFPSVAEGCGLPLLESLWLGVPCVCSDIAALIENASGGGCSVIGGNSPEGWTTGLRQILEDDSLHGRLASEATGRALPTWAGSAAALREALA